MKRLAFSLPLLLAACMTLAGGRPSGDTSGWETKSVDMGEIVVSFRVPPGASSEYSNRPLPTQLDLADDSIFDDVNEGPVIFDRSWDYRNSSFSTVDGVLSFRIVLEKSNFPLASLESLTEAVRDNDRLSKMREYLRTGERASSNEPIKFIECKVGGAAGLRVVYELSDDAYVIALGRDSFLLMSINSGGFRNQDWSRDAKDAAKAMLQSVRISHK